MDAEAQARYERFVKDFETLSPDQQEILASDVEKFRAGAIEHGPLDVLDRSLDEWVAELTKEVTDLRYYLHIIRRHRERMPPPTKKG